MNNLFLLVTIYLFVALVIFVTISPLFALFGILLAAQALVH